VKQLETSDRTHYPELYSDGCCGCVFCGVCPATTAFLCGSSGPCCGAFGLNGLYKLGHLKNMVRAQKSAAATLAAYHRRSLRCRH
jgi:hypothetical protein